MVWLRFSSAPHALLAGDAHGLCRVRRSGGRACAVQPRAHALDHELSILGLGTPRDFVHEPTDLTQEPVVAGDRSRYRGGAEGGARQRAIRCACEEANGWVYEGADARATSRTLTPLRKSRYAPGS